MVCQLLDRLPARYFIAFKAGRWELPLLLLLVLVDELNPIVRIYAWRMLLGREGLINDFLRWTGHHRQAARLAAVHQVLGDPRALHELGELLCAADLRLDEGDQARACSRRRPTSAPAGSRAGAASCCRSRRRACSWP